MGVQSDHNNPVRKFVKSMFDSCPLRAFLCAQRTRIESINTKIEYDTSIITVFFDIDHRLFDFP